MSSDTAKESPGPPRLMLLNPISGTTIPTNPEELGLNRPAEGAEDKDRDKSIVMRTVDKLNRKKSGESKAGRIGHRRIFSLNRKKQRSSGEVDYGSGSDAEPSTSPTGSPTRPGRLTQSLHVPGSSVPQHERAQRPSLQAFRAGGSMRPGTQTLIQALQAIAMDDEHADEDGAHTPHERANPSFSSDDEDRDDDHHDFTLASSIHTIHRPVAHSRITPRPGQALNVPHGRNDDYFTPLSEGDEEDDFEPTPAPSKPTSSGPNNQAGGSNLENSRPKLSHFNRSASLATVRLERRAKLAAKLKEVFGLSEVEEVVAEMPCWLLRSVLLQGYIYLTNAHLCFFAHMPSREDQVLKSGSMSKKAQRTKRWNKHWFILKNDVLSWYQSSTDPYFPHGNIDLRYAISCDPYHEKGIRLRTNTKNITLDADSVPSRDEWVKAIRKVIFKAQNMGESVKIVMPFSAILDVERSTAMDFSETIEVKVVDKDEHSIDSYFFAYFHDLPQALEHIRSALKAYKGSPYSTTTGAVIDTTSAVPTHQERSTSYPATHDTRFTSFRLSSLLKPFSSEPAHILRTTSTPITDHLSPSSPNDHLTSSTKTIQSPPRPGRTARDAASAPQVPLRSQDGAQTFVQSPGTIEHTYPPSPGSGSTNVLDSSVSTTSSNWGVPSWLRNPSKRLLSSVAWYEGGVQEVYEGAPEAISDSRFSSNLSEATSDQAHMGFSMMETPDHAHLPDPGAAEKFRTTFAFDEKEVLLASISGYLFRVLPVYGKIYISTNYFCFRASQPLIKTKMILPIRDILTATKEKAFTFTRSGLVIVIKGHEELFLEFSGSDKRDSCVETLESQMEELRKQALSGEVTPPSKGNRDALILGEFEAPYPSDSALNLNLSAMTSAAGGDPVPPPETLSESLPAVMFTSASSTFLSFKPRESLHFTCLTIGSRGDVQPYIALCKGLKADGHRVRIASHVEYKDWVEGHGIEFSVVGGDPAELMRICVENGTFTVAFLKEGMQKFRGWVDDLLATSWDACQGTDVLIESPSAMGGIHIAEALQIPFFRAFTMPWTRTRAYPHAFAVPERKMGGSYNYMTYVMFDQVFWRATAGQINRWRRNTLGLDSTNLDKMEPHKVPFLYNFSPSIVPPPLDWYEWIRVTGYWFLDDPDNSTSKKWTPPEDLVKFIDGAHAKGKKVVYIGFGSIVVSDPESMTKCVVESVIESGVYCILSKGWSDRLATKKADAAAAAAAAQPEIALPEQIYPIQSIPHDWLFPRIDAVCHHGGAGTTGASLRAGVPTIIKPFFGDQLFWADRVEALGIGSGVRKLTVENLTAALRIATTDMKQVDRARLVGQQIRSENGVANAVEAIYRDLEYARSLIKRPVHDDEEGEGEEATITERRRGSRTQVAGRAMDSSMDSSNGSGRSEDWSVISDDEDPERLGMSTTAPPHSKRRSLAATTLSVLHHALAGSIAPAESG